MIDELREWIKKRYHQLQILSGVALAAGIILVYQSTAQQATIVMDGDTRELYTHARSVSGVIRDAGIDLHPADYVFPGLKEQIGEARTVVIRSARSVLLIQSDEAKQLWTYEEMAGSILLEEEIALFPNDRVWIDGIPYTGDQASGIRVLARLEIQPAAEVDLEIDGSEQQAWLGGTLGEALWKNGIRLFNADAVSADLSNPVSPAEPVTVNRSFPLVVEIRGVTFSTRVLADTPAEALNDAGVILVGLDSVDVQEESFLEPGQTVRVSRVVEEVELNQEPLPFEVVYQADPEAMIDTQSLLEAGEYGVQAERVRIRYVDGEEVARLVEGSWIAREPQPRIVGYGTKIEIRTLDTPDGPIEYWREIDMYATSYSPSRAGVPDDYPYFGITACGIKAEKGVVAVDRRYVPFYSPLYIPGYGPAIACDTGGAIVGRRIDLGYEDDNWETWHWNVTVYFLTPVPDPANISWVIP